MRGGAWELTGSVPLRRGLFVRAVSKSLGWVIADGRLKATSDGGATWQDLAPLPAAPFAFDVLGDGTGAVLAGHPKAAELYVTKNSGRSWTWIDLGQVRPRRVLLAPGGVVAAGHRLRVGKPLLRGKRWSLGRIVSIQELVVRLRS